MNILLIDDDALVLRTLSHHLGGAGHNVTVASDASQADDFIEREARPDLVICDLLMPGVSGLTFISLLRNFHNLSIPVIVISGLSRGDLLSAQAGVADVEYLPKPIVIADLFKKINKYTVNTVGL